jgi:hypothetical protein
MQDDRLRSTAGVGQAELNAAERTCYRRTQADLGVPGRDTAGDQMNFVESMEIDKGLIRTHGVYRGWFGVKVIGNDRYRR